jgi:hypothetical protein
MHYVGKLALSNKPLSAVFPDFQIGKIKTDCRFEASVILREGIFELNLVGRPESMTDQPMRLLSSFHLNLALPRFGQKDTNGHFSDTDVKEVIDTLDKIFDANNI